MKNKLEIDSINKSFGAKKLLSDIYLKCETGDIIGVFGRNGSGKSTLLQIIYGTIEAENKFIRLDNAVIKSLYKTENAVTFLPQNSFLPKEITVAKAIKLWFAKEKRALFFEDKMITNFMDIKIGHLSGGERQYLLVKMVLFSEAKFCLLDEPFSGIAPIYVQLISDMILDQSKYKGIIITDHNYQYLLDIATKIYLIKDGYGRFLNHQNELIDNGYLSQL